MAICEKCGKKPSFGNNVSHAKNRTRRSWKPNIQKVTMSVDGGAPVRMKICTHCLRSLAKTR